MSEKSTLRFITCGSVDDGKSTLIGRLLYEERRIYDDQLTALEADSRRFGTQSDQLDLALLVDGLQAEREQGITIDVAYRYFATSRRVFIVADCPGHEQYTRNMATGASTADLAVLLVDARKGLAPQTHRHARIVALMGIRHVVLAVNKLDLVDFDQAAFDAIAEGFQAVAQPLGFTSFVAIPLCALTGDNVSTRSARTPWYGGPTLVDHLEQVEVPAHGAQAPFRMPVQWVNRSHEDFRGYCGTIAAGEVRPGDHVVVLPSRQASRIERIVTYDGDLAVARAGEAVTLTLADERDVGRGDVLAASEAPCELADQFEADLVWFAEAPLVPGRAYSLQLHTASAVATVTRIKWQVDVTTGAHLATPTLPMNGIATVNLSLDRTVPFASYQSVPALGAFILIDRGSQDTVGAGMIHFALRRSANVQWHDLAMDKEARAALKGQMPRCIWLTGLSGAGKSTVASLLEQRLHAAGRHTYVLDGDNVRHGLNRDLGFTEADRVENIRRVSEVARLMVDAGLIVIVSLISPFRTDRDNARARFDDGEFVEVFVDAPLEVCARRDPKGLYGKAARGELSNFTGVDSPYEPPEAPEIRLDTERELPEQSVERILDYLTAG